MRRALVLLGSLLGPLVGGAGCDVPPDWGARALLQPMHRPSAGTPAGAEPFAVEVAPSVTLRGWLARGVGRRRGLVLYLHGVGDNKDSAAGLIARYTPRGFDVAAYDARAHGESDGAACTYGYYEKADVARVLDVLTSSGAAADRTVLFGSSMGAAVALQAAPLDGRVRAVVAQSPFAELGDAARSMRPFFMTPLSLETARLAAEERAHFRVAEVSPLASVRALRVPLLLVHGVSDSKLPVEQSRRLLAAAGSADKTLVELPGAGHDDVFAHPAAWDAVDGFIDRVMR